MVVYDGVLDWDPFFQDRLVGVVCWCAEGFSLPFLAATYCFNIVSCDQSNNSEGKVYSFPLSSASREDSSRPSAFI